MDTLEAALKYSAIGLSVIPVEYGGKRPLLKWEEFQKRRMTEEEIKQHFSQKCNIGIVCGAISGNLVAVDFDDLTVYEKCNGSGLFAEPTLTHKSGKGVHKLFMPERACGCFRISQLFIDVKGEGGYIVAPPSWHEEKKKNYEWDGEFIPPRKIDSRDFRGYLLDFFEERLGIDLTRQKEVIKVNELLKGVGRGERDLSSIYLATLYRKRGLTQEQAFEEMRKWDILNKPPLGEKTILEKIKSAYKPERPYRFVFDEEPNKSHDGFINDLKDTCKGNDPGKNSTLMLHFLNHIKASNEYKFVTFKDTEELYYYNKGVYAPHGDRVIKELVQKCLKEADCEKYAKTNLITEIIGGVIRSNYAERDQFKEAPELICFENGILNIETNEFFPHSPEYKFLVKIPIKYDSKAKCPKFGEFIKAVLEEDDQNVIQEFFGYVLYRGYPIQKAFMLTGSGSNGKSVLLNVLKKFVGQGNATSCSIQELEENQFAKSRLYGKLANIYPDLSDKSLHQTGIFKALVGGDSLTSDKKFKDPITFENYAKLIFSANKLPETKDDTDAFFRRWIIITFPNTFSEELGNLDPFLFEKISTEDELSGILNWAIAGLRRLLEKNSFSYTKTTEELRERYTKLSDSLAAFVNEAIEQEPEATIEKEFFYNVYSTYCRKNRLLPKTKVKIGRDLASLVSVNTEKKTIQDNRKWVWKGIKWKEEFVQTVQTVQEFSLFKQNFEEYVLVYKKKNSGHSGHSAHQTDFSTYKNEKNTENQHISIQILSYIDKYVGLDGQTYGGWDINKIVQVPTQEADFLVKNNFGRVIQNA